MRPLLAGFLAFTLAGCINAATPGEETQIVPVPQLSTVLPTMQKVIVALGASSTPTAPVEETLGLPREETRALAIPENTWRMQLAIDVGPTVERGTVRPGDEVAVKILDSDGALVYEVPKQTDRAKFIEWIRVPTAGEGKIVATYKGLWKIGVVAVFVPDGFTPGTYVNVSYPAQTEIDHSFAPDTVRAGPGEKVRFTTYDFDPHAGVENLQHNVYFPDLNVKTEGRTTWGEVRTLDFTAPATAGKYEFYCEFHDEQLKGTLVVE